MIRMAVLRKRVRPKSKLEPRERRRFRRFAIKVPVSYTIMKLPPPATMVRLLDSMRRGTVRDISQAGAGFVCSQILLPGTTVRLNGPSTPLVKIKGRLAKVIWVKELRPGRFKVGLKFL